MQRTLLTFMFAAFTCLFSCSPTSELHLPPAVIKPVDFELMDPLTAFRQGLRELRPLMEQRVPFHMEPSSHPCSKQCKEGHLAATIIPIKDHNFVLEVKVKDYWYEEFFFNVLFKMDKQNMLFLGSGVAVMTDIDDGTFDPWLTFYSGEIALSLHQERQGYSLSGSINGKFFDRGRPRDIEGPLYFHAHLAPPLLEAESPSFSTPRL